MKRQPSDVTADTTTPSVPHNESTMSLGLSSRQITLLLSSIWAQSISPLNTPEHYQAIAHTHSLVLLYARTKVIDDHLKPGRTSQQEHDDIVDVLLKIVREQTHAYGAAQLGHNNIKAVLLDLFLAGINSSAITMVWAMAELARKPRDESDEQSTGRS